MGIRMCTKMALLCVGIMSTALFLSSCGSDDESDPVVSKVALSAVSNFEIDNANRRISWDEVDNAESYTCYFDIFTPHKVFTNYIEIPPSIEEDVWRTIRVYAVAPMDSKWSNSKSVSFDFILTDKTILDTPKNFTCAVLSVTDNNKKIKLSWDPIPNAASYEYSYTVKKDSEGSSSSSTTTGITEEASIAAIVSLAFGELTLEVRALPAAESETYVSSKRVGATLTLE